MRESSSSPVAIIGLAAMVSSAWMLGCTDDTVNDTAAGSDTSGDGDGDATGDGDGEPASYGPARGISLTEVEANQGTAILIGKDGQWVGAGDRNAYMIRNRDTLVRTQHVIDEGFIPRNITGVLHLRDANGIELGVRTRTMFVEADSEPRTLSTQFYFSILAEEALPGLSYWVELREADAIDVSGLTEGINVTPPQYELIGYEETPLEMKVVVVPIHYTYLNPPTLVELTDADLQAIHDDLLQNDPLQEVFLEVHEPYEYSTQLSSLGQLLSPMSALRGNDQADPNVYYHALVDVHSGGIDMVAGIANLAGDTKESASMRVAATVWFKQGDTPPASSTGTIVHEIGHNQGLQHVFCSEAGSPAAGPDPTYPHEDGVIGVYGFGIRNFRLYTPTGAHDYMTYCGNAWTSDWTWNKTYRRIKTLTSWDYAGATPPTPNVPLLVGTLFEDGSEEWWVMMGPAPRPEELGSMQRIALARDGVVDEQLSAVSTLSDGKTQVVVTPLPVPVEQLDKLARLDWQGAAHPIEIADLRIDGAVKARH